MSSINLLTNQKVPKSPLTQTSEYLTCRQQVINALADLPQGELLSQALLADSDYVHLISPQQTVNITQIKVREGHGAKNLDDSPIDTQFQAYLENVINPQIDQGILSDGSQQGRYDDRKVRWSGSGVTGCWSCQQDILTLEVAPTSYPDYRLDLTRSPLETLKLMLRGLETDQDPYAYFARAVGVAVIPLTTEGNVYLGKRLNSSDYTGMLNFVAGWATFSPKVEEINFYQDAQRELEEEMKVSMTLDQTNTRLVGASGNPLTGEVDLVFVVQTEISDRHFQSNQWEEHSRLIGIHNKTEAENLLKYGLLPEEQKPYNLMFSSRLGLEYLVKSHW
ncbi:MAG: hypothetical protein QNJ42_19005 [Crocosphaera sp.]|nr:hypothetical protein [Crocosphaera sp.]